MGERHRTRMLQYYSEEQDESILFVYRFEDIHSTHLIFPGHIREDGVYLVEREDGRERLTGRELSEKGLTVELKRRNSGAILRISPWEEEEGTGEEL